MVAAAIKGETTIVIKKMRIEHTCLVSTETTRVSAKWLTDKYESLFTSDITTNIRTLIDACMEKYGVDVPKSMAYRAKNLAIDAMLGEHKKQYHRLRDYAQTVMDTNPGTRVVVTTITPIPTSKIPHPGPRFHVMFCCINGPREGFLKGCRPFIGVDGCFIKLTTGTQLLVATRRDGNNNTYPLVFGIVGKEDTASWCWFLHQLKICLEGEVGQFGSYTIMSNRQKGLLNAVNDVFPNCNQSEHKFNIGMNDLRVECKEAWKWPCAIPKKTWARHAFDTNCKTDLAVNNLCEVFNKYALDVRKKPIRTMCDGIKDKQMVRWHRNRESGKKARWEITPDDEMIYFSLLVGYPKWKVEM
ncbi:WD repeat-containing protein 43 [Hordeum vulgare]|nr:WD repeat-containing protein 43 [Hordeum vulgare]